MTPARAGTTRSQPPRTRTWTDDPRSRGDDLYCIESIVMGSG